MQLVVLPGVDRNQVARTVGGATFVKGVDYARRRRVIHTEWDSDEQVLAGQVRGTNGAVYNADVLFGEGPAGRLVMEEGTCSCPVGWNCKHVVALALTAAQGPANAGGARPAPAEWERSLRQLLEPGLRAAAVDRIPLGVELSLAETPGAAAPRLSARLVRPGKNGWVGGDLAWSRLDDYFVRDYRPEHVRLVRELHSLHRLRSSRYSVGHEKSLDLSAVESRALWTVLDEAAEHGLALVHARKALGPLDPPGRAEVELDVSATDRGLAVVPRLIITATDGNPVDGAEAVCFVGADGHGVVWAGAADAADGSARRRLGLARTARPVPAALQAMVLRGQRLDVPPEGAARFGAEFFPRLRGLAPLGSVDGTWSPPEISRPRLVLHADHGAGHVLDLRWKWCYEVDGTSLSAEFAPSGALFRDEGAERAVLDALDVPRERLGLAGASLRGRDTLRFVTEVLPLLTGADDVEVEVRGEPADYRDAGDSLQIHVSTDEAAGAGGTDWFDLGVSVRVDGREVPFGELFRALAAGEPELLLADGAWFSLDKPELAALRGLIEEARALQDRPGGPLRISRFQAGLWEELAALGVVDRQARAWREQVAGLLELPEQAVPDLPAGLHATLRPYQHEGFAWLAFLWRHRLGGILADDMGLGKTVQTLALLCHAREREPDAAPFLIVAPTSVVPNWAAEAARFAPDLRVVALTDTLRRRGQDLAQAIDGADVVVTTYTLLRLDADAYTASPWSGVVLDEAQHVKNHQAKVYQCVRRLPAPFRLAVTGTPMENNLMELWALLSVAAPGLFPSPTRFREDYARPLERQDDPERLARLRRRIRPLVLRRTKDQVAADLPEKQQQVLAVDLDAKHRRIYQRHLQRERQKVLGLLADVDRNRFTILTSLTLLRRLALHPGLVEDAQAGADSAKVETLVAQLDDVVRGGHRALVFSQFTGFLALVRARLDAAGIAYAYLDGSTRRRGAVVDSFRTGTAPVFLISLKAGGAGLNLTEADYVFLLDPWWNPATEAQAVDRTHRIGQTRTVMVQRLIARDTIEEKVLALAERKAALVAGVMDEGALFASALDEHDIRELLS